jgi:1-aminocyclopropane-1-carboxylate synthase
MITAEMLTDNIFVDAFLDESRDRLVYSYRLCVTKLEEMVIPYIPAEAGMFVYADFSSLLQTKTFEEERRLCAVMVEFAKIVLTPGESQHEEKPGMMRICYAWVSPEVLAIAMERLSRLVVKLRKMDWSDFNEATLQSILEP